MSLSRDLQDFLQVLSIFAAFKFEWPPLLVSLYNSISLASFNLELLAPECSIQVNYMDKWLVTQALPLILVLSVGVVLLGTRLLQLIQRKVFKVLPFGAAGELNLVDVCIGILISGSYYLYFRKWEGSPIVGLALFLSFLLFLIGSVRGVAAHASRNCRCVVVVGDCGRLVWLIVVFCVPTYPTSQSSFERRLSPSGARTTTASPP